MKLPARNQTLVGFISVFTVVLVFAAEPARVKYHQFMMERAHRFLLEPARLIALQGPSPPADPYFDDYLYHLKSLVDLGCLVEREFTFSRFTHDSTRGKTIWRDFQSAFPEMHFLGSRQSAGTHPRFTVWGSHEEIEAVRRWVVLHDSSEL